MRNILTHVEISPSTDSVLRCSLLVARMFSGYIEGFHMRPGQPDVIAAGADGFVAAAPDLVVGFEREARERAEKARQSFSDFVEKNNLPASAGGDDGPCAKFVLETASGHSAIGSRGRTFDLLVVGRPLSDQVVPSLAALESALFDSGRPLLVAPPVAPDDMGKHVVIAWNCSTETATTIAMSMPFLKRAKKVTVLSIEKGLVPGPSGADLCENLKRHGMDVDHCERETGGRSVGQAILEETKTLGGDLLLKGAYTQSRLRQMIFGGATSHILAEAEVPVLMAN